MKHQGPHWLCQSVRLRRGPRGRRMRRFAGLLHSADARASEAADFKLMQEEIFGPVLTVFVYPDDKLEETLDWCDQTSPYALTGAVFAQDRAVIELASARLRHAAGNLYINDKPTGAVVNISSPSAAVAPRAPTTRPEAS